ncbi:MAG: tetratricopeptide repeat protein [Planctomycetes bacterium]|nr:tetratricopeptide repeat protein [Planctomycetota bacterium]
MGDEKDDWSLPELRGNDRDDLISLLDRAAEVGLLTVYGGGFYAIHPALPWFFGDLFERFYADQEQKATWAFVEAMGELGSYYQSAYNSGKHNVIVGLQAEEANLLQAQHLARIHNLWDALIKIFMGLNSLYRDTARESELFVLNAEIKPYFVDLETDGPLLGREKGWGVVTESRVLNAIRARHWNEAERLQRLLVDSARQHIKLDNLVNIKEIPPEAWLAFQHLAAWLDELGRIQRFRGAPGCVASYKEAFEICMKNKDKAGAAIAAFNLGHAYEDIPSILDLSQSEQWYYQSLNLRDEQDKDGRAVCFGQLGHVSYYRFNKTLKAGGSEKDLLRHLNMAIKFYHQDLKLLPTYAIKDLAVVHHMLGMLYGEAGNLDKAMEHYRLSIRYREKEGDIYFAGKTRKCVAIDLFKVGRLEDALEYAQAALRNFESFGDRAADDIKDCQQLITKIQKAMKKRGKG